MFPLSLTTPSCAGFRDWCHNIAIITVRRRSLGMVLLYVTVIILLLAKTSQASHFMYGTISNIPLGSGTQVDSSDSRCISAGNDCEKVQFLLQAAFRRNYRWGRYFGEQWRQGYDADSTSLLVDDEIYSPNVASGEVAPETAWHGGPEEMGFYNSNPQFDENFGDTESDSNGNSIVNENFFIRFPAFNGEAELYARAQQFKASDNHLSLIPSSGYIVPCEGPFTCDELHYDEDTYEWVKSSTSSMCAQNQGGDGTLDSPYDFSRGAESCAAWEQLYGMYLGDGTSTTIELTIQEIENSATSLTGNYIKGSTYFYHYYEIDTSDPFVGFFTGGNRMSECSKTSYMSSEGECANSPDEQGLYYRLNNNAESRFRLEIEIWIRSNFPNRSPIASQIPIVPVMFPEQEGQLAKFQIAAYDPDTPDRNCVIV